MNTNRSAAAICDIIAPSSGSRLIRAFGLRFRVRATAQSSRAIIGRFFGRLVADEAATPRLVGRPSVGLGSRLGLHELERLALLAECVGPARRGGGLRGPACPAWPWTAFTSTPKAQGQKPAKELSGVLDKMFARIEDPKKFDAAKFAAELKEFQKNFK